MSASVLLQFPTQANGGVHISYHTLCSVLVHIIATHRATLKEGDEHGNVNSQVMLVLYISYIPYVQVFVVRGSWLVARGSWLVVRGMMALESRVPHSTLRYKVQR